MGKANITHSLQSRAIKPNSFMYKACFAQKVINLFTNAIIKNSHPGRLEMIHWHAVNAQICRTLLWTPVSHSFQPTGCCKVTTSLTVSMAGVLMAPRRPLTPSSGILSQDPTWGTPGCVLQSNPAVRFAPGQAVSHHAQVALAERSQSSWAWGALSAAWAEHSQGGTDSRSSWSQVCKLPSKGKCLGRHSSNNTF